MSERIYVSARDVIEQYENNLVTFITSDGRCYEALEPRRLFPVNSPDTYITLLDKDGAEIALIRAISELSPRSRDAVVASLEDYYLVPTITRIVNVIERYGTLRWIVETDRGEKSFDIRNRNHDIKVYPDGRVRIRDADDNRYVIRDYRELDVRSRRFMLPDL